MITLPASMPPHCSPMLVVGATTLGFLRQPMATLSGVGLSTQVPSGGVAWRFETSHGQQIELPRAVIAAWERPPYAMLIRLVSDRATDGVLAEAVIGTRVELQELTEKIVATMLTLLRAAVAGRSATKLEPLPTSRRRLDRPVAVDFVQGRLRRLAHRWQDRLFIEQWGIGTAVQSPSSLISGEPLQTIKWVQPGGLGNLADPHPWPNTQRILCEEFGTADPLGRILAIELDGSGRQIIDSVQLLGEPFHRSYPGAVVHQGDVLLLPETPERGQTIIYRMSNGGALETICHVAPDLRMADPTLFWHGNRPWIAYTDLDIGVHDNLCLLHAEDVRGPWTPHAGNPVKLDIRSSRPAGSIIRHDNVLYRPAQDCARSYGAAVVLHRIETLTADRFEEVTVRRFEPRADGPFPHGLHTLSADGRKIFVDGKRRVLGLGRLASRSRRRIASLLPKALVHV